MEEQCTMRKLVEMSEKVRTSTLELERSKVNYYYHNETYTDSMSVVSEQRQKLKLITEDSSFERDDQIIQMELMTKLVSAYRLHAQDHNFALFRLRHSTSALSKLLQIAKTLLTENSPIDQHDEENELRSLIQHAETVHFRY